MSSSAAWVDAVVTVAAMPLPPIAAAGGAAACIGSPAGSGVPIAPGSATMGDGGASLERAGGVAAVTVAVAVAVACPRISRSGSGAGTRFKGSVGGSGDREPAAAWPSVRRRADGKLRRSRAPRTTTEGVPCPLAPAEPLPASESKPAAPGRTGRCPFTNRGPRAVCPAARPCRAAEAGAGAIGGRP